MSKITINCTQIFLQVKYLTFNIQNKWLPIASLVAAFFFLTACEEVAGDTGIDVLPDSDIIEVDYSEDFQIDLETRVGEPQSSGNRVRQLLGTILDPQMGTVSADMYTQFSRETRFWDFNLSLGPNPDDYFIFDSVTIDLNISSAYGRFNTPQLIKVEEIQATAFPANEDLLSTDRLASSPYNLCDPPENCLIDFREDLDVSPVRFRLDNSLGRKLILADSSAYVTDTAFVNFFRGLKFEAPSTLPFDAREPGGIFRIFLNDNITSLNVHYQYRTSLDSIFEPLVANFPLKVASRKFHSVNRKDFEDKLLGQTLSDPTKEDAYEFIQDGALVKIFGKFSDIEKLGRIGINRADLVLKVDQDLLGGQNKYIPPSSLSLILANENGEETTFEDTEIFTEFTVAPYENGSYVFVVTSYIQALILGDIENNGFFIRPSDEGSRVNRAIIGGVDHPTLKPQLRVTFTGKSQ